MNGGWTIQTLVGELAGRGERPCLLSVSGEAMQQFSCASLSSRAMALARGLCDLGVRPGEPVGLIAPNSSDWVIARLALGCVGALAVAMDELSTVAELKRALPDTSCRRILTSAAHVNGLRDIDAALQLIVLDDVSIPGTIPYRTLFSSRLRTLPAVDPNAPMMLVHTSGTTGAPKAFTLTSSQVWANVGALTAEHLVGPEDRVLLPLPLHHVYPFVVGLLTTLSSGAAIVFSEGVGGPQILQALSIAEVSTIIGVPRLYAALVAGLEAGIATRGRAAAAAYHGSLRASIWLRRRFGIAAGRWLLAWVRSRLGPRLRLLVSGGAYVEPELLWLLVGLGLTVRSGYGLAETASTFTGNLPGRERLGSEGCPFQGGEVRIAAADSSGEGEIELRGPSVFSGYRNNDEANREAFTSDGWFRTGDTGRLDGDGFLYVTGRIKETIALGGGKKVHPEELEKLYRTSPYIREIAILERGGALAALVLPDLQAIRASGSPRVEDIVRVALSTSAFTLPSYQRLAGYRLVRKPLPRTRLGKYERFRLPAIYDEAEAVVAPTPPSAVAAEDRALLEHEPARNLYDLLKARYPRRPVSLDASPLLDLGIDSLEWVALGVVIEQQLGLRLDEQVAGECFTVRDLLRRTVEIAAVRRHEAAGELQARVRYWLKPAGPMLRAVASLICQANALLTPILFCLTPTGLENLPARGPYVMVANHQSDLDPLLIAAVLGAHRMRQIHWGGDAARLFTRRWLYSFWRALRVFPVDERKPSESLALALEVLRRGESLVWFPESWRSPNGRLQHFLPGIGRLLADTGAPAVPTWIEGSFDAMPRSRRLPRLRRIRITIGQPLSLDMLLVQGKATPQAIADRLHDAVAALGRSSGNA
jgi:long-chain acyl-CoA synthetase